MNLCAIENCRMRVLHVEDDLCSGHMLGFLCPTCSRAKRPKDELCRRCTSENAKDVERTTAPPVLRLIRGGADS